MNIKGALKTARLFITNNSPTILTVCSIFGVGVTTYNAIQDSRKADYIVNKNRPKTLTDEIKMTWKSYIPTGISASMTIACIVGSHVCSEHQKEALSSAYLLSQTTLQEYQKRVVERIGKNKERELYDDTIKAVAEKQVPAALYSDGGMAGEVIDTGHGNTLFYDEVAQVYFKSDIGYLKNAKNDMNSEILNGEMYYDWNEIMYRWGLPCMTYGKDRLITAEHLFDPRFVPEMMDNGQVRIVISYDLIPASEYSIR